MIGTIGYVRTDDPDDLASARRQQQAIVKLAGAGSRITLFEDLGYHGGSLIRPALAAAIDAIRDGEADTLTVASFERLTTDPAAVAVLWTRIARPWHLTFPGDTISFGQWSAHPHHRLPTLPAGFGYMAKDPDPNLVRWAVAMTDDGQTPEQIAAQLTAAGIPRHPRSTRTVWTAVMVRAALADRTAAQMTPVQLTFAD